jgi:hypothetical protein
VTRPVIAPESLMGSTALSIRGAAKRQNDAATRKPVELCVLTLDIDAITKAGYLLPTPNLP